MFALTRKTDYALVALVGLAAADPDSVSTRELSTRLQLPLAILRNILKGLASQSLVTSTHGPRGGYRLARPAAQITLVQVVEAIEGPMRFTRCCPDVAIPASGIHQCRLEHSCLIRGAIRRVHGQIVDLLASVTVADLAADRVPALIGLELGGAAIPHRHTALSATPVLTT